VLHRRRGGDGDAAGRWADRARNVGPAVHYRIRT
jgi:hypothetical protein